MFCSDIAMMDWYHDLDTEDFVVPKDEELLDRFPSPDSWQQWGKSQSQNFGWNMALKKPDLPDEKSHQKTVFGKSNGQISSLHESESPNDDFSMNGGWPSDSWCENSMVQDRPDFQFNDLMRNDHMDDIFLSSLLKEDPPATENNDVNGNSENLMYDLQSVSGAKQSAESSRSTVLNDHHVEKACESNVVHPSYNLSTNGPNGSSGSGCTGEEVSLEESVLNDLGVTLTQLSNSTRLCFRDSLYRLAQNSAKQTLQSSQVKDPAQYELSEMEVDDERIRSGETETESETNTIDRAVANFVFKKMDVNTQDLRPAMSATKRKCEAADENKGTKYISFSQPEIFDYPPT